MLFSKLFEPGRIGKMEVKNRICMAPMGTDSHDPEGFITDRTVDYYAERAKGGVGLIMGQSSVCLREGRSPGRPGTWDDKFIPGLKRIADAVHRQAQPAHVRPDPLDLRGEAGHPTLGPLNLAGRCPASM